MQIPTSVLVIARTLEAAGHETWCVGGAVRDSLLGHSNNDWDLTTAATPTQIQALFPHTVPVGIEFGTVGVLDLAGDMHEVTTFREDKDTDGRHAVVEFGTSLSGDLARRDFTINAIAFRPSTGELYDPFGGREDLAARVVRAVGNPEQRMVEDRLRALRALRFAGRLNFSIDGATWDAVSHSAPHLERLSAERIVQELEKTMDQIVKPGNTFQMWRATGVAAALFPELTFTDGVCEALDRTAPTRGRIEQRLVRFAVLFGDTELQADEVLALATRLKFSRHDAEWLARVTKNLAHALIASTGQSVRRSTAHIGRLLLGPTFRVLQAFEADPSIVRGYRRCLEAAQGPLELRDLAVSGTDLLALGIPSGPQIGRTLQKLLQLVIEDPSQNTKDHLLGLCPR
jgi:tRNA nucleotidyltransferase (CCA-adding enzyme)